MMVLLTSDAFVAGHGRAPASRVRTAQVLMRELFFSELDEGRAVAFLQQWPKRRFRDGVNTWGNAEWQLFGLPSQLEFTSEPLPNGVRLAYYLSEEGRRRAGLSGLVRDGSFELSVDMQARWLGVLPAGPAIVTRTDAGRESKAAYERIIWQRLVLDFTKLNRGRDFGTVRGVYPCPDGGKLERIDRIMSTDSLWRRGYKY